MAVHGNVKAPGPGLLGQIFSAHGNIIVVPMGQKGPVASDHDILFPVQTGEKVIVAQDHLQVAAFIDQVAIMCSLPSASPRWISISRGPDRAITCFRFSSFYGYH